LKREPARQAKAADDARITEKIRTFHAASGGTNGSPRITADLREDGEMVNHKRSAMARLAHWASTMRAAAALDLVLVTQT
jgi:hypothetical protein